MSAEILRRAAAEIREEWQPAMGGSWSQVQRFYMTVAELLDDIALGYELGYLRSTPLDGTALAVAHAYLTPDG